MERRLWYVFWLLGLHPVPLGLCMARVPRWLPRQEVAASAVDRFDGRHPRGHPPPGRSPGACTSRHSARVPQDVRLNSSTAKIFKDATLIFDRVSSCWTSDSKQWDLEEYFVIDLLYFNPLWTKFFFRLFSGHNLLWALFVYRLIGATLIGNFFDDPFFWWNFGERGHLCPPGR